MEKILLGIDAINPSTATLDFACFLGRLTKSKITGVFLENLPFENRPLVRSYAVDNAGFESRNSPDQSMSKSTQIEKNISFFKDGCTNRNVNYRVHRDRGVPAQELIEESRFADLLVVDAETSFNRRYEGIPTDFVTEILKEAECPVIIAPESFEAIDQIVFTYNGSASSVFAIKIFTYLFPQFRKKKVTILQVNETGKWMDHHKYQFKEWLSEHYTNLNFEALKGDPDKRLFEYLSVRENTFLVMGAYGRNFLSEFFQHSHADLFIKTVMQPIFITHM